MTEHELRLKLIELNFPKQYEVNAETYGNACQSIINREKRYGECHRMISYSIVEIVIGQNNGLMFKGVELILKEDKNG